MVLQYSPKFNPDCHILKKEIRFFDNQLNGLTMNTISSSSPSSPTFGILPADVKNYIYSFLTKTCKLHSVSKVFRKIYMDQLQADKGLYGKNLVYEGIPYYIEVCEWLDHRSPTKKENIEINKKLEKILIPINIEKTIYNVCGGKEKFKALKTLPFDDSLDNLLYTNNGLIKINRLRIGESVMRGADPNQHPFIAMSVKWITPSFEENRILVLHQKIHSSFCHWKLLEISRVISIFDVYISTDVANYMRLNYLNNFSFFQHLLAGSSVSFLNGTYQLAKQE